MRIHFHSLVVYYLSLRIGSGTAATKNTETGTNDNQVVGGHDGRKFGQARQQAVLIPQFDGWMRHSCGDFHCLLACFWWLRYFRWPIVIIIVERGLCAVCVERHSLTELTGGRAKKGIHHSNERVKLEIFLVFRS